MMITRGAYKTMLLVVAGIAASLGDASGQCAGSFGENTFASGDFGSGSSVLNQTDPGLAPGFIYSTSVPLADGEYVLTNDMGKWPANYGSWLSIQDNSPDPQGYMMVVNASFAPGIFYEEVVEGLCVNTLYEVTFDAINVIRREVPDHILPDLTLLIDDMVVLNTGSIAQDETWHTFSFSFTATAASVKVTLRNNAPGGIGNDLAIDNITFKPCGPEAGLFIDIDGKICENGIFPVISGEVDDPSPDAGFQWQISFDSGITWEDINGATTAMHQVEQLSAGTYLFRYLWATPAANIDNPLCRTISDVLTVEVVPIEYEIVDTICSGLSFDLGGQLYDTSGVY
ncbi:MAG: hypothetical protein R3330_07345, partial [Saprospiraceae bacterium]|nr:hypothetical protein [Saprospiraceae bacterium]